MSPKAFEHRHRDDAGELPADHQHREFGNTTIVPSKWREHLQCRLCKQQLIYYIYIPPKLHGNQKLVLAGCFDGHAENQAWEVSANDQQPIPRLNSSAKEADTRIWLHVFQSFGGRKFVFTWHRCLQYRSATSTVCFTRYICAVKCFNITKWKTPAWVGQKHCG